MLNLNGLGFPNQSDSPNLLSSYDVDFAFDGELGL